MLTCKKQHCLDLTCYVLICAIHSAFPSQSSMLKYPYTIIPSLSIYRSLSITLFHHQSLSVSHHTLYTQPSALYRLTLSVTLENYALIQSQCAHYTHTCHSLPTALFPVCCSLRKVVVILRFSCIVKLQIKNF